MAVPKPPHVLLHTRFVVMSVRNASCSWLSLSSIVSLITVMLMLCHVMCHVMVRHANARLAFLSFAPSSVFIK